MNIVDLRNEITEVFNNIKAEKIELKKASELSNAAGKIIGTLKVELAYRSLRGERPEIQFLDSGTSSPSPATLANKASGK